MQESLRRQEGYANVIPYIRLSTALTCTLQKPPYQIVFGTDHLIPTQFAPKRPVKKEPKANPSSGDVAATSNAGPSATADEDDPFAALMQQAEAEKSTSRKPVSRGTRGSKFQVAFGASSQQCALLSLA